MRYVVCADVRLAVEVEVAAPDAEGAEQAAKDALYATWPSVSAGARAPLPRGARVVEARLVDIEALGAPEEDAP